MGVALVELSRSAAATVVALLATDAWGQAKAAVGQLWRRIHPQRVAVVEADLDQTRAEVLAARLDGNERAERDLVAAWQMRLGQLLDADPRAASVLAELVERVLRPALAAQPAASITMHAGACEQARIFQAGRDQNISGS